MSAASDLAVSLSGKAFPPLTPAQLALCKVTASKYLAKGVPTDFRISTPITEGDLTRWKRELDESSTPFEENAVCRRICPDVAASLQGKLQVSKMCPMTPFLPSAAVKVVATKQITHKAAWLPYRQKVPVYMQRNDIVGKLRENRVVVIVGDSHTGKSTQVPQIVAETEFMKKRIVVVCGTAHAAICLARRIREEKGEGEPSIAHVAPASSTCTPASRIVTTTYDMYLRSLITNPLQADVSCIVLDDLHSHHDVSQDLCLDALRELVSHASANLDLRIVACTRDQSEEAELTKYFRVTAQSLKIERVSVVRSGPSVIPLTLHLDETVQWLQYCARGEGGGALIESKDAFKHLDVDPIVVKRVSDGDDTLLTKKIDSFDSYWLRLICDILTQYDAAERSTPSAVTASVVVLLPTYNMVVRAFKALPGMLAESSQLKFVALSEHVAPAVVYKQIDEMMTTKAPQRLVVFATPRLAHNASSMPLREIGCLVDFAVEARCQYDAALECDKAIFELPTRQALASNRSLLQSFGSSQPQLAFQLLPASTLHSLRVKQTGVHPVLRMPFAQVLDTVQYLLLRNQQQGLHGSISSKFAKAVQSKFFDVPQNIARGDTLDDRQVRHVEMLLQAMGHIDGSYHLTPLGAGTLATGLPLPVARLLILAATFSETVLGSLTAALWMVGDLFGSLGPRDDNSVADARHFFSKDKADDFGVAVNAFAMWRRIAQSSEESDEAEFLEFSKLSKDVLVQVRMAHKQLLRLLHDWKLTSASPSDDDVDAFLVKQDDACTIVNPVLSFCITAALYPMIVYACHDTAAIHDGGAPPVLIAPKQFDQGFAANHAAVFPSFESVLNNPEIVGHDCSAAPHVTLCRTVVQQANQVVMYLTGTAVSSLPALVVLHGEGSTQPIHRVTRSRGWSSAVSNAWRNTKAARVLKPAQIQPKKVELKRYNPIQNDEVTIEIDRIVRIRTTVNCSTVLSRIRDFAKRKIATLVSLQEYLHSNESRNELRDAILWLSSRCEGKEEWLRERRQASDKVASVHLLPYLSFSHGLERPQELVAQNERAGGATLASDNTGTVGEKTSTTFTGRQPSDESIRAIIHQTAELVGRSGHRDSEETKLLSQDPFTFAFLHPSDGLHEYYLYILKKEAPHLDWLGDDLEELEKWLQEVEKQVIAEVGFLDAEQQQQGYSYAPAAPAHDYTPAHQHTAQELTEEQYNQELRQYASYQQEDRVAETAVQRPKNNYGIFQSSDVLTAGRPGGATIVASQFLSPEASAAGIGSSGPSIMQSLLFMRGGAPPAPSAAAATADEPSMDELRALMSGGMFDSPPEGYSAAANNDIDNINNNNNNNPIMSMPPPSSDDLMRLMMQNNFAPSNALFGVPAGVPPFTPQGPYSPAPGQHPLAIPPPALPQEAIDKRSPSVLIHPIPPAPSTSFFNMPLALVKALGETMGLKVGPALIVGEYARIEVPNRAVEQRALALKQFICLGSKTNIVKNDRIVDNPNRPENFKIAALKDRLRDDHPKHLQRVEYDGERAPPTRGGGGGRGFVGGRGRGYQGRGGGSYQGGGYQGGGGGYSRDSARGRDSVRDPNAPQPVTSFVTAQIGAGYLQPPSFVRPEPAEQSTANEEQQ